MVRTLRRAKLQPVEHDRADNASGDGGAKGGARGPRSAAQPRQGTSRSYAERKAKGRPNVTVSMATETVDMLAALAVRYGLSRSAVIDLAIRELAKKRR